MKIFFPGVVGILGWSVLLPALYLMGSVSLPLLKEKERPRLLEGIYFVAFGLIFFLLYLIFIGSFGWLRIPAVLIFIIFAFALRASQLRSFWIWFSDLCRYPFTGKSYFERFLQSIFLVSMGLTFLFCLLPETSNDGLCYQLNIAKHFARQHSIWPQQYDLNSYMPLAMNYFYSVGLLFHSVPMAKLFNWWSAILLVLALAGIIESITQNRKLALLCGLMFWLTPTVMNEVTTAYVDIGTAYFVFLSFCLIIESFRSHRSAPFFLSGLLMGAAVGIKFSLLSNLVVVCLFFLFHLFTSDKRSRLFIGGIYFLGGVFLVSGYWFVRNYWVMGNPFFPYFGRWFGTIGLDNLSSYLSVGLGRTWLHFLLVPWNLTFYERSFDQGFWIGPLYLLTLPVVLLVSIRQRAARPYLIFTFLFVTIWFFICQASRYLLPTIPVWVVAIGIGLDRLKHWLKQAWTRRVFYSSVASAMIFLFTLTVYHYRFQFLPVFGIWSYDTYLKKLERSYPIAAWINENVDKNVKIFNVEEIRQFYFDRQMVREGQFNIFHSYWDQKSPREVLRFLMNQGFTHILRTKKIGGSEKTLKRLWWLDSALADQQLTKPIVSMESENIRENRYEYMLYQIRN